MFTGTLDRKDLSRKLLIQAFNYAVIVNTKVYPKDDLHVMYRNCRYLLNLSVTADRQTQKDLIADLVICSTLTLTKFCFDNNLITKFDAYSQTFAFAMSFGAYIEQESKKEDQWRDQTYTQLYQHIRHEFDEVDRSLNDFTKLLHNLMDLNMLAVILLAKIISLEQD